MARAQESLHLARLRGNGHFVAYAPSPEPPGTNGASNAAFSSELVAALNEKRLKLSFQPVVDIRTRKPVFHEALLRLVSARIGDHSRRRFHRPLRAARPHPADRSAGARTGAGGAGGRAGGPPVAERLGGDGRRRRVDRPSFGGHHRPAGSRRPADRRDHRDGGHSQRRRGGALRRDAARSRLPGGHRRFRRRLLVVPPPARSSTSTSSRSTARSSRACRTTATTRYSFTALTELARNFRHRNRRRVGAGRGHRGDARRIGASTTSRAICSAKPSPMAARGNAARSARDRPVDAGQPLR